MAFLGFPIWDFQPLDQSQRCVVSRDSETTTKMATVASSHFREDFMLINQDFLLKVGQA